MYGHDVFLAVVSIHISVYRYNLDAHANACMWTSFPRSIRSWSYDYKRLSIYYAKMGDIFYSNLTDECRNISRITPMHARWSEGHFVKAMIDFLMEIVAHQVIIAFSVAFNSISEDSDAATIPDCNQKILSLSLRPANVTYHCALRSECNTYISS